MSTNETKPNMFSIYYFKNILLTIDNLIILPSFIADNL